jgi:hypothetical protein
VRAEASRSTAEPADLKPLSPSSQGKSFEVKSLGKTTDALAVTGSGAAVTDADDPARL